MGWAAPMPVQKRVTPVMRRGRDLIAQAMTGSGKTGAFGLPSLEIIDPKLKAPQVLVLAPTRELALQIENEIKLMSKYLGHRARSPSTAAPPTARSSRRSRAARRSSSARPAGCSTTWARAT